MIVAETTTRRVGCASVVNAYGELSEGAGGEVREPLRDVLEAIGPRDRDADDAGGSRIGELRERGREGIRHDRCEGDVAAAELFGGQTERGCHPAAWAEERGEHSSVAGEVHHRVDAVWV